MKPSTTSSLSTAPVLVTLTQNCAAVAFSAAGTKAFTPAASASRAAASTAASDTVAGGCGSGRGVYAHVV